MERIILHWTAGEPVPSSVDRKHYHVLIDQDGKIVLGVHRPEANSSTADGRYAAHTRMLNTGSIGVAVCGMLRAQERPFQEGAGLTRPQIEAMADAVADLCETYGIPVTRSTVLSHAEVQPTLGVAQRGKWDITWLPGMDAPGDPVEVGDRIRDMVRDRLGGHAAPTLPRPTLRVGDRGRHVREAQELLAEASRDPGPVDGIFGSHTMRAVQAFQRIEGLFVDSVIGPETWDALLRSDAAPEVAPEPRPFPPALLDWVRQSEDDLAGALARQRLICAKMEESE